ncbi:MAG: hypothetical protein WBP81_38535 [Solirubrobacteraceae bacterium]
MKTGTAIAESVTFSERDDESIGVSVVLADLGWDENPAPGRDQMTGAWHVTFRDSLPKTDWRIDLPRTSAGEVRDAARRMVAERLMGDSDLTGGQPHIIVW